MTEGTAVRRRRVRLLNVPAELQVRNMRHLDDLLHELRIMQAAVDSGEAAPGPRLASLMSEILETYAPARDTVWQQAEVARAEGREVVDLDVELPAEAAGAAARLLELLEEADRMCEALQLLTMAAPPEVTALRRWISAQIVAQVDRGEEPEPFRG